MTDLQERIMGGGIDPKKLRSRLYGRLKRLQWRLHTEGLDLHYCDLELRGPFCVIYYAGAGPASNGEIARWLVLRFNPKVMPSSAKKQPGDVDYTDFHTRDIPEMSKGGFDAGVTKTHNEKQIPSHAPGNRF